MGVGMEMGCDDDGGKDVSIRGCRPIKGPDGWSSMLSIEQGN